MFQSIKEKLARNFFILNVLFILSGTAMTWLFSRKGISSEEFKVFGIFVSFILLAVLVFRYRFLEGVLQKITPLHTVLAFLFASVTWYYYGYKTIIDILIHIMPNRETPTTLAYFGMATATLAFFSILVWYGWFFEKFLRIVTQFTKSLDKNERIILGVCSTLVTVAIMCVYYQTIIFYMPHEDNIIFNSDSSSLVQSNVYFFIEAPKNSIKQPLFGLYAMPFSVLARVLAKLLFFLPNGYIVLLAIIQAVLLQISLLLLSRMMNLSSFSKVLFLVLFNSTYPVFIFSLTYEQYLFAVFWLILFIYAYVFFKDDNEYYFIGAAGSMLTSGILFPLLSHSKKWLEWINDVLINGGKFVVAAAIFGQLPVIMNPIHDIQKQLHNWSGNELSFGAKFLQYINFVATCLIKPETKLNAQYLSYQLAPVRELNYVGVSLLVIALIGFLLNYQKLFARICFSWAAFSFVLLCIIGWGTNENGLVLYTLYFSWAFLSLAYMAIESIAGKIPAVKYTIIGGIIVAILVINIPGILDLIQFGINYYYVQ